MDISQHGFGWHNFDPKGSLSLRPYGNDPISCHQELASPSRCICFETNGLNYFLELKILL